MKSVYVTPNLEIISALIKCFKLTETHTNITPIYELIQLILRGLCGSQSKVNSDVKKKNSDANQR